MTSFSVYLVGVYHRDAEAKEYVQGMSETEEGLTLVRDPANPYDENAIQVHNADGLFLGFIAKEVAADMAPLLDAGETYEVRVVGFASELKPLLEIEFDAGGDED